MSEAARKRIDRLYRACLFLYPVRFRRRYGDELLQAFRDDYASGDQQGLGSRLRFWAAILRDLAASVVLTQLRELRDRPLSNRLLMRLGTLALTVGFSLVTFNAIFGMLLRPLPMSPAEQRVRVWDPGFPAPEYAASLSHFIAWEERTDIFESIGAYRLQPVDLVLDGRLVTVPAAQVSVDLFDALGIEANRGRTFRPTDTHEGSPKTVVIVHDLWRRLGSPPEILSWELSLAGQRHSVIGVLPKWSNLPGEPDVELFVLFVPTGGPGDSGTVRVRGRLHRGIAPQEARTALAAERFGRGSRLH